MKYLYLGFYKGVKMLVLFFTKKFEFDIIFYENCKVQRVLHKFIVLSID